MNNSLRGALWSALVFPGSGQIVLKHVRRGVLFAVFSAVCVIVIVVVVAVQTWNGLEEQALSGNDIGFTYMLDSAFSTLITVKNYILPPLLLCWGISVADAWRLGRGRSEGETPHG